MKTTFGKLLLSLVLSIVQIGGALLVVGAVVQSGGRSGSEFPYLVVIFLTLVPLLSAIWMRHGSVLKKISAWAVGVACVVVGLATAHPIAMRLLASHAQSGDLYTFGGIWPLLVLYPLGILFGLVPVWLMLRGRSATAPTAYEGGRY